MGDLLQDLQDFVGQPELTWVARWSRTGRGFRLHQTEHPDDAIYDDAGKGQSPHEAITNFLPHEESPDGA